MSSALLYSTAQAECEILGDGSYGSAVVRHATIVLAFRKRWL
jgi:hypothetical protein